MKYLLVALLLICSPAWSATQLKKTVCPSGCDYTSIEACLNANEQNLVTNDKYFDVEVSGNWSSEDTTAHVIHNYTTDATRYINIYAIGDARNDGTAYKSGSYKLHLTTSVQYGSTLISVPTDQYITIDGLTLIGTYNESWHQVVDIGYSVNSSRFVFKNNVIRLNGSNGNNTAIYGRTGTYYNNVIFGRFNYALSFNQYSAGVVNLYNNTIYGIGSGVGIKVHGSNYNTCNIKNNIVYNTATDYEVGGETFSTVNTSNNLSEDATSPDTSYRSKTLSFTNVTSGSENFHLVSGDTDAIDDGTDLSGTFTTDIDGTTRSGTWDIGADEYVSSSPTRKRIIIMN